MFNNKTITANSSGRSVPVVSFSGDILAAVINGLSIRMVKHARRLAQTAEIAELDMNDLINFVYRKN